MQAEIRFLFSICSEVSEICTRKQANKKQIFQLFQLNFVYIELAFEVRDQ